MRTQLEEGVLVGGLRSRGAKIRHRGGGIGHAPRVFADPKDLQADAEIRRAEFQTSAQFADAGVEVLIRAAPTRLAKEPHEFVFGLGASQEFLRFGVRAADEPNAGAGMPGGFEYLIVRQEFARARHMIVRRLYRREDVCLQCRGK